MRRRLAPKKSADPTLPHTSPVREGCWLSLLRSSRTNHVSLVKSPERRPWALKREGRPAAFAGRSESVLLGWDTGLAYRSEYPIPSAKRSVNLRSDRTGKDQGAVFFRTSSATKRTRYSAPIDISASSNLAGLSYVTGFAHASTPSTLETISHCDMRDLGSK